MGNSYLLACVTAGMHVRVSAPEGFQADPEILDLANEIAAATGGSATSFTDPIRAVAGADVVATDTWISMGKEAEAAERVAVFGPWQVNDDLMAYAKPDAIVLHCLPAYRGKEISGDVLDGPRAVIWDEAENRRHAQKAIMSWLHGHRG